METHLNPIEQQRQAKLSLLNLDDDNQEEQPKQILEENQHWGRSLETQSFLREKLSQRYEAKRKSNRQLRSRSTVNKENKQKKLFMNDKQSLKDLLKKLESKEMRPSNMETLRNSMIVEFKRGSKERNWPVKNQSNRSTIDQRNIDNRSMRRGLKQLLETEQNNFISKKLDTLSNKRSNFDESSSLLPIENYNVQQQSSFNGTDFVKRREYLTESKLQKRVIKFRKNTENKQNQVLGFLQFPLDPYKNGEILKNTVLIMKNEKNRNSMIEKEQINKRTFQILQQINRTKSINNVKKLTSQSLKLKKPQLCPYSRVLKDRSNFMNEQNRSRNNILLKNNNQNIWVKLEIRK